MSAYEKMLATRVANIKNIATISPKTIGLFRLNSPYPKSQIKIQNNRSLKHIFDLIPKLDRWFKYAKVSLAPLVKLHGNANCHNF